MPDTELTGSYYKQHGYKTIVMGASFRNVGEITELAGCDYLTIAPKLLEELKNSSEPVPKKLDASKVDGEKMEKVSYLDDEAKFRWAMFEDTMAFDKLHEGIRGFAKDGASPYPLSVRLLTSDRSDPQGHDQEQVLIGSRRRKWIYCRREILACTYACSAWERNCSETPIVWLTNCK